MKNITPERWQQIDVVLDAALDLPEEDRGGYLDKVCDGDPELRAAVERMLGAGEKAGTFLEQDGPADVVAMREAVRKSVEEKEDDGISGQNAGPYRLIRPIGKGGMGQVYLAVRDDESYTRYVAVKVIRRGMDTDEIQQRFRTERRILASLNHPNIAQLLDGGATDNGLSYFVMEYIQGESILEYCDAHRLSVRDRLGMFNQVCSAVQFAHQNLVVHRDLKPSNILVTPQGVPKLLDFGIAKVLNPDLAGFDMQITRRDARVMTPEYASPEQMRGAVVTTASDVYQLGVLMYELLTGALPHATEGASRAELERLVLEEEPDRPSTAVSRVASTAADTRTPRASDSRGSRSASDRLKRVLSGDLDRITLMALRKEPERRYASVDLLREDVRRYLDGMPVLAQDDTWSYRASKFVRRHTIGVAASVALGLLLVSVAVLAVRYAVVTSEQSVEIAASAAKTDQVSRFLVSLFEYADPEYSRGRDITARELVDRGAAEVDRQLAGQPDVQAHMLQLLGVVYREMSRLDEAETLLERSLAMRRAQASRAPLDLAESMFELGVLRDWQGLWSDAEPLLQEALDIRSATLGPSDPLVAQSLNALGAVFAYQNRLDEAEPLIRRALEIQQAAFGTEHRDISETITNLAWVLHEKAGDDPALFGEAETRYREALVMQRKLMGPDHPFVAATLNNLGALLHDTGRFDEAEEVHRDGLRLRRRIYGEDHAAVTNAMNQVGRALFEQGRLDEAEPLLRGALQRHQSQLGERHVYVGRDMHTLAVLLVRRGQYDEAEDMLIDALAIYRESLGDSQHPFAVAARESLDELNAERSR